MTMGSSDDTNADLDNAEAEAEPEAESEAEPVVQAGTSMTVGIISSNEHWLKHVIREFNRRGHDTRVYQNTPNAEQNTYQLGQIAETDLIFCDWAQPPLDFVLQHFDLAKTPVWCRAHRVEMYNAEWIQKVPWERLQGMFFIAEHVRERFAEKWQLPPPRVITLPHVGVDEKLWALDEDARKWEPPWQIIMAGNLVPKKRQYTAAQMVADLPDDFHLKIIGQGGMAGYGNIEYHANITDLVQELDVGQRILGYPRMEQDKLAEALQQAHLVISASNEEGCHAAVAEGMACGCVPLLNAWRGVRDIYPEEWVWRTPKEFYALVRKWARKSPSAKAKLARAMREFVLPRYDVEAIAREMVDAMTGPLTPERVGEWYSTGEPYQHMVAQDGGPRQEDALKRVRELLPAEGEVQALEIGCGTAYVSRMLAEEERVTAYGQDVAEGLITWANEHNEHEARLFVADATKELAKSGNDVVMLIDVLEHIPSHLQQSVLIRAASALKPGGVLIARIPHGEQSKQIVEEVVFPKLVRQQCQRMGLGIETFEPIGGEYFEIVARKPKGVM